MKSAYSMSTQALTLYSDNRLRSSKPIQRLQTTTTSRSNNVLNRVRSAQPVRAKYHTTPVAAEIPLMNEKQSPIPLKIYNRYLEESYLAKNHETILREINLVPQDAVNHLNINYFSTQQLNENSTLYEKDSALLFKMYDTLIHLDREIIQELFIHKETFVQDQIGQLNKKEHKVPDNFRFDFFIKTINIMDDFLSTLLHKIEDKTIAVFIEQLWKFWVVILDINTQWSQTRYQALLEIQVGQQKRQYEDLEIAYNVLREKYVQKMQGSKLMVAVEQKKNQNLKQENMKLFQQCCELQTKLEELNSLECATGDLYKINAKLKEVDHSFIMYNREITHNHQLANQSIKGLAQLLKAQQQVPQSQLEQNCEELKILDSTEDINYITMNPIVNLLPLNVKESRMTAREFLQFLWQNWGGHPNISGPEIFCIWIEGDSQRINLIPQLQGTKQDDQLKLCRIITGIGESTASFRVIDQVIKLNKFIDSATRNSEQKRRASLILNEDKPQQQLLNLEAEVLIKIFEEQQDEIYSLLNQHTSLQIQTILLIAMEYYRGKELSEWESFVQRLLPIQGQWNQFEQFYNMDIQTLSQYLHLRDKNQKDQNNQTQTFKLAYQIWLNRPRILIKQEVQEPSQRSPLTAKTNSRQQFFKKSITSTESFLKKK